MKKQLFYRSPDRDDTGGNGTEEPVDETTTSPEEETSNGENTSEESGTEGEESGNEENSSEENSSGEEETTNGENTSGETGTEGEESGNEENSSEENSSGEEETTNGENTSEGTGTEGEESGNEENSSEENSSGEEETTNGENTSGETGTEGEESGNEENSSEENSSGEEETTNGENTSEETGNEGEETGNGENSSEENSSGEEETTNGENTSGETGNEGEESGNEENSSEENSSGEEETSNEENTSEESGNEEHPSEEHHIEEEETGNHEHATNENNTQENNTVSTPPTVVEWPGSISATPVTTPGDELAAFTAIIKANRSNVPEHLTDKNKVKNGYMYDPFSGKPQPQPASIQADTVDAWIWEELRSEGSYTSINTYDNMIVTWGRGVAGSNIAKVLKGVFSEHSDIQTEFNNVGIRLSPNGILQVVDADQNCIKEGNFALQTIKADKKLLDFLVDISLSDRYKEVFLNAQWNFVKTFNASLFSYVNTNKWSKDAVQLMFHCNWWLPAHAWAGHPQSYKDTGGDVNKIIYLFATYLNKNSVLVGYLKKFAGNAFSKYVAKPAYETQPDGEHIVFVDGAKTYYFPKL